MTDHAAINALLQEVREYLTEDGETPSDTENLIEWGLDSIGLMNMASRWRRDGLEVSFGELAAEPTLARWRELLVARAASAAPVTPAQSPAPAGTDGFRLAPLQHAYWIGRQDGQELGGVAAHLYTEFDGPVVDQDRLTRAVAAVVRRHPMLRVTVTGDGTQRVLPTRDYPPVTVLDLRAAGQAEVTEQLEAQRQRRSHQLLDIEAGQVFDLGLTLLPAGRSRLHVDVDMVAADARSYRVLLADLARCYAEDTDLGDAPDYGFARYLAEHSVAAAPAVERAARWWAQRLDELPGAPELPVDSGLTDPGRTGRRSRWLAPELRDQLAERARRHGVTLAMALATAYAEVIGGWSAPSRFLLNVPLFDREPLHPDVPGLVGDFTSSVLLDVDLRESAEFAERARRLQAQLHERAEHAAYSGVHVLRELTRARGEQVVAPVVFTSALGLGELFHPDVLEQFGEPVWIISQGPQVLLDAQVTELHGGVLVNWDVRENLLKSGVADAMFTAFLGLLDRLAGADEAWREPVGALLGEEQRAVRARVNDTSVDYPRRCVHERFFARAGHVPDAPALLWGQTGVWSYGELAGRALRVAAALRHRGMRPGDTVAVSLPKGTEQIASILGVLAAGGTYLPIGADQPDARMGRIMSIAGARLIITDRPLVSTGDVTAVSPAEALDWPDPLTRPELADPDSIAYLLFTSGSTGEPKGVEVPHVAAMNTIEDLVDRYRVGATDRALGVSAMEFDLSVFDVFGLLSVGGAVVVVREEERKEARDWARLVRERGVTLLNCVPALLDMLLVVGESDGLGDSLRVVLLGGDWVGVDLPGRLAAQVPGCRFVGLGGTTETAIHSTQCEVSDAGVPADWRAVPYGVPLHNVACRVVDEQGRDRPDWAVGEVWIGGASVAAGYRGDPARTAAKFLTVGGTRWYRTGDLGRYWPDGTLEFLGRADHQVKLRGYRIELGEVEAALAALPGVRRAVARLTERRGGSLQAVVAGDLSLSEPALRAGAGEALPGYMVPELIVVRAELPLTRNGKPDRRAIAALLDEQMSATPTAAAEPRTALERVLLDVWRETLENDSLGIDDDFLTSGGDSVLATRIVASLRDALQTDEVRVRDVFTSRTVAALATTMMTADPRWEEIAAIAMEVSALTEEELEYQLRQ
ncbi:MAG TPA: amino acid adenylation domain-containing protein [Pseudonocardia sp.]|uniref:amino acid adenylation domain-containing protein n=1 Tax=Pseudonocardia sp. TaxID=60912 RepID=UPI002CB8F06A|nr:amino acid adenylation domain-containing protein [Pseudonocardia sp.]HTF52301.1 amino acid adenylation domain-containing protein [Pseudonocardia sp.]